MKTTTYKKGLILWLLVSSAMLLVFPFDCQAQEEETEEPVENTQKPARPAFEGTWIIDNQTVVVPQKGTFEFMIQHRFGSVSNGITDLYGLFAPSNIRLGFNYTLTNHFGIGMLGGPLSIGFGTTKDQRIQDLNLKFNILQQTRSNSIPVSVTYYANVGIETFNVTEDLPNGNESDRLSYFHQLIIACRITPELSFQVMPSLTHYNVVDPNMKNDHYAIGFAGRFKVSAQSSVIFNVDQPITKHTLYNPEPNVGFGMEVATSSHTFQVFITSFDAIVPQRNNLYNKNDPWDRGLLIGFNINRLWNF